MSKTRLKVTFYDDDIEADLTLKLECVTDLSKEAFREDGILKQSHHCVMKAAACENWLKEHYPPNTYAWIRSWNTHVKN